MVMYSAVSEHKDQKRVFQILCPRLRGSIKLRFKSSGTFIPDACTNVQVYR